MKDLINELQLKIERLESEISFKNGLISMLSHDSKEMFGNFLWLVEALEEKTIGEEDFLNLLPQIKSDARKNLQTIHDSTSWLKTQYGEFKIKPEKIIVMDLFHYFEEKYAAKLKEKNIKFYFKGNPNAFVTTDRFLLEYVLDKILNNAVKYSLPGQDVYLQEVTGGDQVILSVIDFGTGMAEKYLSAIFTYENAVFQGTAGEKGVGLSLKIVKNFVSLMHGNIQIISAENAGTTVSLFFT
ncbi:HAMP domain-containing histidine kinase [Chryseobacterium sp. Ch-15]|uniref:histidine kinase n=1 Tax=Chryseobacterium muglaense TaxID=2893752 RepID=A0A9Q3UUB9_9FLAO|nr:HAMP domain-containing sensor histidine kinase [Chryseobacterium muglaense]MBD3907202.1 HAMP domain-containing histidine kinase [Chryseobacterium muglaense]MCC9033524.1 HAMP domain-containing histidine kinase [Chryseobacterium muglaense]MCM2556831.1 HAMP domain-containing histidine kinase [Chryseobacterium muglaense]